MSKNPFATALVTLITITFVMSSTFLIAPQKAHATLPVANIPGIIADALNLSEATINAISNVASQIANWAQWVNTYILQPIAFVKSGNLMKALTAGVISFAVGTANGTGAPQFVQNLSGHMQKVGDVSALSFLAQLGKYSNSPFKASIASSLKANYYQNTSLAGFFVANTSTLDNVTGGKDGTKAFLAGNWSNGGIAAWLALTTQDNNNPYTLYQNAQGQMASLVTNATAASLSQLSWGQGMLSWCGATSNTGGTSANGAVCTTDSDCASNYCENDGEQSVCGIAPTAELGMNPGDNCTNKDGTPGEIKTPGSVIKSSLDKVLGGNQDKLVQVGRMASEIGSIMGSIATVWDTVKFAENVLGGSGSDSGLFGFGTSVMTSPANSSAYNGATDPTASTSEVYTSVATSDVLTSTMLSRIDKYKTAWETIKGSAKTASTSVLALIKTCNTNIEKVKAFPNYAQTHVYTTFVDSATIQKTAAQSVLDGAIKTVFDNFETASTTWNKASRTVANIKTTLTAGKDASTDIASLTTMSPTNADLKTAMYDATIFDYSSDYSFTSANPNGSLTVSGGTIVDQMALISTNAKALETSVCTWPQTSNNN